MKKTLLMISLMMFGALYGVAEDINAVYFNPSRLGAYEVLRVADRLQTQGPLHTASMSIQNNSVGEIKMTATGQVPGETYSYKFDNGGINAQRGIIDMPATLFEITNVYVGDSSSSATGAGGDAAFVGKFSEGASSEIATLGKVANTKGSLNTPVLDVTPTGDPIVNIKDTLKLGGNEIPTPSSSLGWVKRWSNTDDGWIWVLAQSGSGTPMYSWRLADPYNDVGYCDPSRCGDACDPQTHNFVHRYISWTCVQQGSGSSTDVVGADCNKSYKGDKCHVLVCDGITEEYDMTCE